MTELDKAIVWSFYAVAACAFGYSCIRNWKWGAAAG